MISTEVTSKQKIFSHLVGKSNKNHPKIGIAMFQPELVEIALLEINQIGSKTYLGIQRSQRPYNSMHSSTDLLWLITCSTITPKNICCIANSTIQWKGWQCSCPHCALLSKCTCIQSMSHHLTQESDWLKSHD